MTTAHRELDANAHIQAHAMHVRTLAHVEQFRGAVASPAFAYARARMICGSWVVTAYCRDANSPTGVLSAGSATVTAGEGGAICIPYHDGKRTRFAVGYVGEDGIEAGKPYTAVNGKLVTA